MSWTEEKIDILKDLWEKDYSASEIADQIGSVTRNAVISKANRLGLKSKANKNTKKNISFKTLGPITLHDLTESMCKWPFGDPQNTNFHFCGKDCFENLPYCGEHAIKAYHTVTKKRMSESKKTKIDSEIKAA